MPRMCAWCPNPIPPGARSDAETCSQECRQARHRFRIDPCREFGETPMRFAIADPPYIGLSKRYYEDHEDYAGEVDHVALIKRLREEFPDGFGICMSSKSIIEISLIFAAALPASELHEVRWSSWHKGPRNCVSYYPRDAWEPFVRFRGRPRRMEPAEKSDNTIAWGGRQHSHPGALVGMKPAAVIEWMFRQLGALRGDTMADIFPGSGAITRGWKLYAGDAEPPQLTLFEPDPLPVKSGLPSRLEEAKRSAEQEEEPA